VFGLSCIMPHVCTSCKKTAAVTHVAAAAAAQPLAVVPEQGFQGTPIGHSRVQGRTEGFCVPRVPHAAAEGRMPATNEFGPVLWYQLRLIAAMLDDDANAFRSDRKQALHGLLTGIIASIPCGHCHSHALQYIADHPPPTLASTESLSSTYTDWVTNFEFTVHQRQVQEAADLSHPAGVSIGVAGGGALGTAAAAAAAVSPPPSQPHSGAVTQRLMSRLSVQPSVSAQGYFRRSTPAGMPQRQGTVAQGSPYKGIQVQPGRNLRTSRMRRM